MAGPSSRSVTITRTVRPSSNTCSPWMPVASWRGPTGVSSVTSTSAIRWLRVASGPTNSMPAAWRITLRPPSAPTRYCVRSGSPSASVNVDAIVVLGEAGDLDAAMDRHVQLLDPTEQDSLDVVLPQPQHVRVPAGDVAEVQHRGAEARGLDGLALGEEPVGDASLVEDLERAGVEPTRPRAHQLRRRAPLDDRDIDPRQRQLGTQHQARRPAPDNDYFAHLDLSSVGKVEQCEPWRGPCRKPPSALYVDSGRERRLLAFVVSDQDPASSSPSGTVTVVLTSLSITSPSAPQYGASTVTV